VVSWFSRNRCVCRLRWTMRTLRSWSCCWGRKVYTSATRCSMPSARESTGSSSYWLTTRASVERCLELSGRYRSALSRRTRVATTRPTCLQWCWRRTAISSRYCSCCCREVHASCDHTRWPAAVLAVDERTPRTRCVTPCCVSIPTEHCPARRGSHWPAPTPCWAPSDCPGNSTTSPCVKTSSRYQDEYTGWLTVS